MDIIVVQSLVLDLTSRTILSKFGSVGLSWTGVQSKLSIRHCMLAINWWIYRCDARPDNLDGPGSHRRSHEKTDYLIKNFDPGVLWDEYGIRHDIVVRLCGILVYVNDIYFICSSAIYTWISSCWHPWTAHSWPVASTN